MTQTKFLALCTALLLTGPALAKLAPPSDEAKAKAAEAAIKAAHGGKVAAYKLCLVSDRVAAVYFEQAKKNGKAVKPADPAAAACVDPGPLGAAVAAQSAPAATKAKK